MPLNKNDLYGQHDKIIALKTQTYEKIYNRCTNQIKIASKNGELICFFEIPSVLFGNGFPIINMKYCGQYLIDKFKDECPMLRIKFIDPNILFIDWRK